MDHDIRTSFEAVGRRVDAAKRTAISAQRQLANLSRPPPSPGKHIVRAMASLATAISRHTPVVSTAAAMYGSHSLAHQLVTKALTSPAQTTVAGWAAELVDTAIYPGLFPSVAPTSVFALLAARGLSVDTGAAQYMNLPYRAAPTGIETCFVGEGQPIPVRQFVISGGAALTPKKASVISHYTEELFQHATPTIESVVRQCIAEDIAAYIDGALLGDSAATAQEPAGLLFGVAALTPSADPDKANACADDLSALAGAIKPSATDLVYVMSAGRAASAALRCPGISALTVLVSDAIPEDRVIALDASDFASTLTGGRFDSTDDAALVSRTDPTPISSGASGTGAISAAPVVSLWQQNLIALRIYEMIDWTMRRPGRVQWMDGVTW